MDASPLICKRPLLPTRLLDPAGEKGEKDSGLIEIIMTARSRESKEKSKTAMMKADFISTFRTVIFPKKTENPGRQPKYRTKDKLEAINYQMETLFVQQFLAEEPDEPVMDEEEDAARNCC
uniref:Uncharacterized protein n=1 Tax=Vitis vinifera TaxID=29760 RepID=F6GV66_VITVI